MPRLLPDDFEQRLSLLERFDDQGIGPFARTHDLFGDGSVRLVPLPGHAHGQVGAMVQTGPSTRKLLVADAAWTSRSYRERVLPHPITRFITASHKKYVQTLDDIREFARVYPDIEIIPTHCPEIYERYSALLGSTSGSFSLPPAAAAASSLDQAAE